MNKMDGCNSNKLNCIYVQEMFKSIMSRPLPFSEKSLYKKIAKRFNKTPEVVKHHLTAFVDSSWQEFNLFEQKPTNEEFLVMFMKYIKRIRVEE